MDQVSRRGDFAVAAGLFGVALLLGGGSGLFATQRMIVEVVGVVALGWFVARGWQAPVTRSAAALMVLIVLLLLVIAAQLVPLAPETWQALPGRWLPRDILASIGASDQRLPLSVDPAATRDSALFLIVPIAMLVAALHLDARDRVKLLYLFAGFALFDAVVTMLQAQGMPWLTLFWTAHSGKGQGLFANKNHNSIMLVSAIPVLAMLSHDLARRSRLPARGIAIAAIIFVAIAVFGCLSRAGIAALPAALAIAAWILAPRHFASRKGLAIGIGVLAVAAVAAFILSRSAIVTDALERFSATSEGRYSLWPDTLYAISQYFPAGSGFGTFVPVFESIETLNTVRRTYANHAHSDYLEVVLEAGLPGIILMGMFLLWFIAIALRRVVQCWGRSGFAAVLAAAAGVTFLLAHSVVDYPLRTHSLACFFALALAILISAAPTRADRSPRARNGLVNGADPL